MLLRALVGVVARLTTLVACDDAWRWWWPLLPHETSWIMRQSRGALAGSKAWRRSLSDSTVGDPNAALLRGNSHVGGVADLTRVIACFFEHLAPILLIECGVHKLFEVVCLDISEGVLEFRVETPAEPRHLLDFCGHFVPDVSS